MARATQASGMLYGASERSRRRWVQEDPGLEIASVELRAKRRVDDLLAALAALAADPIDPSKDEVGRYMEEDVRGAEISILASVVGSPLTWWSEEDLKEHARAQSGSDRAGPMWTFALRRLVEGGYLERNEEDAVRISL